MALQIKVTSDHGEEMGDDAVRRFDGHGGTIGRGLQSDWILPDEQRFISGRHATLDYKGGAYYVADISTNGVYINGESEPLGKGNFRRLFDGDRLRMGEFEFEVSIDEGEDIVVDLPGIRSVNGHMDQVVSEDDTQRTSIQFIDENELTGGDELESTLFGTTRMDPEKRQPRPIVPMESAAERLAKSPPPASAKSANPFGVAAPNKPAPPSEELFLAFLQGAGVRPEDIHPSLDLREVMLNAGQVLREFVNGTTDLLAGRANVKSMFRLDQTTVLPRHNNPLKLSESAQDSMKQLLTGKKGEYLGPIDSVKEVCRDLKFHEDAMLEAMMYAFKEFADRFDPVEMQENFDRSLKSKPIFSSLAKMKYWDLYCELYPIMTQTGNGPFPQHMGEEFVRSYENHLAEFMRNGRDEEENKNKDKQSASGR